MKKTVFKNHFDILRLKDSDMGLEARLAKTDKDLDATVTQHG